MPSSSSTSNAVPATPAVDKRKRKTTSHDDTITSGAGAATTGSKKQKQQQSTSNAGTTGTSSATTQGNNRENKQQSKATTSAGGAAVAGTTHGHKNSNKQAQMHQQQQQNMDNFLNNDINLQHELATVSAPDPIALLPQLADEFQRSNGNAGKQGGTVKFTNADIKELRTSGFTTIDSLHYPPMRKLLAIRGISEQKAELLCKIGRQCANSSSSSRLEFQSAQDHLVQVRQQFVKKISTGSSKLDALLQGGIETSSITEIFGEFRSGKTQLVHTLCVMAQFPVDQGGCEGKVCFIDTEGTFRPERLQQVAERFEVDKNDVLDNVVVCRAHNTEHQTQLLTEAAILMAEQKFGLLVVDSVTNLYRTEYSGRGELADRQQHLGRFLRYIQRLADEFGIAVVLTNQVCAKVDGTAAYGPSHCPIGGHVLAHACQTRLSLRKGKAEGRFCKIYDSPHLPEGEAPFVISEGGVADD